MLSSRKSERSKIRRTTWCSISSPRPPGPTNRSAGRSWARGRASGPSTGRRSIIYLGRRYSAGATVVAAAGAVEHDHILDLAQSRLGALSETPAPAEARAAYRGGEIKVKRRLEQTHVVVGFEGRASSAADHDAAQVFAAAAGGGMSSRLFQEVREKRGLAYSIYGFHWDFIDTGLFGFYAASAHKDVAEVVAASLDCLAEAAHGLEEVGNSPRQGADEGLAGDGA